MQLYPDQDKAVTHIYELGETFLYGEMGSGKTATVLTAIKELINANEIKKVLVCAPKKVCEDVWIQDSVKWNTGLNVRFATGNAGMRRRTIENAAVDVVLINFENLRWLKESKLTHFFDMLVIDESTKLKGGGDAFKALRSVLKNFKVRVAMTGTPVAESWKDLFYQMMLVDNGACFGRNKTKFLEKYFNSDYLGYNWTIKDGADKEIFDVIKSRLVVLPSYTDTLPPLLEVIERITLPTAAMNTYKDLKHNLLVASLDGGVITAQNSAVLVGKLQQVACGFLYTDTNGVDPVHVEKMFRLNRHVKDNKKTVIFYQYKEELARLTARYSNGQLTTDINTFKRGECQLLAIHPKSAGHGVDLTIATRCIFMSAVWSRDLMRQSIARLWRRGQTSPVESIVLVGKDTIEETMIAREEGKATHHAALMSHLS